MQTWEQTYPWTAGGELFVEQDGGNVRITGWSGETVQLTATSSDTEQVEKYVNVHQDGSRLRIQVVEDRRGAFGFFFGRRTGVDLVLMVPYGASCRVSSDSGDVVVEDTRGDVKVDVDSGDATLAGLRSANVQADSGDVTISRATGNVRAEADSGDIRLEGIEGDVRAEADSGDVTVVLAAVRPSGEYHLAADSGDVRLAVPPQSGIEFEVEVDSGEITVDGLDLRVIDREEGRLRALLNGGGARACLQADSGDVFLSAGRVRATAASPTVPAGPAYEPILPPVQGPLQGPLQAAISGDAALVTNEHIRRVLEMVKDGKLKPDEAEAILRALDEEEAGA